MSNEMLQPGMHVQPSPLTAAVGIVNGNMVALHIETVVGTMIFLLEPDMAKQVGEGLIGSSRQAKTGLIVPQNGHLPGMPG